MVRVSNNKHAHTEPAVLQFFLSLCWWRSDHHVCPGPDEKVNLQDGKWEDIHVTTGALKMYFRELPEPLFTYALFHDFIGAISRFTHTVQSCLVKSVWHVRRRPINCLADYLGPFFWHLDIIGKCLHLWFCSRRCSALLHYFLFILILKVIFWSLDYFSRAPLRKKTETLHALMKEWSGTIHQAVYSI